ncbi:hypothetical protein GCM10027259_23460 [Micromonospora palomenae]
MIVEYECGSTGRAREAGRVIEPRQALGGSAFSPSGVAGIGEMSAHQNGATPEAPGSRRPQPRARRRAEPLPGPMHRTGGGCSAPSNQSPTPLTGRTADPEVEPVNAVPSRRIPSQGTYEMGQSIHAPPRVTFAQKLP